MQIWAGLGNPGGSYALHRHNVGFMAADIIGEVHGFSAPKKAFRSELREVGAALQLLVHRVGLRLALDEDVPDVAALR